MATDIVSAEVTGSGVKEQKKVVPSWARKIPKRTIVLGVVAGVALILFWVFQSTATLGDANADPNALLAPWRYALAATVMLWVAIVSASGALLSWLLHVRDIEYLRREIATQNQMARKKATP